MNTRLPGTPLLMRRNWKPIQDSLLHSQLKRDIAARRAAMADRIFALSEPEVPSVEPEGGVQPVSPRKPKL